MNQFVIISLIIIKINELLLRFKLHPQKGKSNLTKESRKDIQISRDKMGYPRSRTTLAIFIRLRLEVFAPPLGNYNIDSK